MGRQIANALRDLFRRHKHRLTRTVLINGALSVLGYMLLHVGVTIGHHPVTVSLILSPIMMVLGFALNWLLVWRDRQPAIGRSAATWTGKWVAFGGASQTSFAVLVGVWGWPYWLVRPGVGAGLALPSYVFNNLIVFPRRKVNKA